MRAVRARTVLRAPCMYGLRLRPLGMHAGFMLHEAGVRPRDEAGVITPPYTAHPWAGRLSCATGRAGKMSHSTIYRGRCQWLVFTGRPMSLARPQLSRSARPWYPTAVQVQQSTPSGSSHTHGPSIFYLGRGYRVPDSATSTCKHSWMLDGEAVGTTPIRPPSRRPAVEGGPYRCTHAEDKTAPYNRNR